MLIEKGCVVNSIYHYPTNMVFFTTPELLEIGDIPMTSLNEKPGRTEALKYYRRVADHTNSTSGSTSGLTPSPATTALSSRNHRPLVARTVSRAQDGPRDRLLRIPNMLNVPGEDLEKVIHYYKEPHPVLQPGRGVIGAKNSAAIAALELYWTGARSRWSIAAAEISDNVKYWIKPNIENRIKNGEIKAYFHSRVVGNPAGFMCFRTPEGEISLKNDFVFALTGYSPDLEFLNALGIALEPQDAAAPHRSRNAGKRAPRHLSGGRHRRRHAHQRNFHRERPLSRQANC